MCKCKTRKFLDTELLSVKEFCVDCGRIWEGFIGGEFEPTKRFHAVKRQLDGVWIGHTFVKDRKLASVLRKRETK